jgi:hypothetical protein
LQPNSKKGFDTLNFITEFLGDLGSWLSGFWGLVSDTIDGALALFWNDTTGLTILGTLMLFGLAVGLIYFGMGFVQRLIRK